MEQERVADAVLVVETAAQMPSMQGQEGQQLRAVVVQLKSQKAKQASSGESNGDPSFATGRNQESSHLLYWAGKEEPKKMHANS